MLYAIFCAIFYMYTRQLRRSNIRRQLVREFNAERVPSSKRRHQERRAPSDWRPLWRVSYECSWNGLDAEQTLDILVEQAPGGAGEGRGHALEDWRA